VVIDTTHPIAGAPPEDGVLKFFTSPNDSLMERLQAAFPDLHFVRAFNSVGSALMVNPSFAGGKPTMFYCGNDAAATGIAAKFIDQLAGKGPTWARQKRRGHSSRSASCGASPGSARTRGPTTRSG